MLFNSQLFIFVFLPTFYFLYLSIKLLNEKLRKNTFLILIIFFSIFFYGYWDLNYLPILIGSIVINYFFIEYISKKKIFHLITLIVFNLSLLFYFKYFDLLFGFMNNTEVKFNEIIIPLGISFFTFQQIGYLIEVYGEKKNKLNFLQYFAFVVFFPQLIAGPILKAQEFFPKLNKSIKYDKVSRNFIIGLIIFFIGLGKKVLIADNISLYIDDFYFVADNNVNNINFFESWLSAIGYLFQLYFDFSGYSDMAVGLARMFGLNFPWNFNSPLKKISIQSFWNNWHITLTRFTTSYVFTPLVILLSKYGVNFKITVLIATFVTFILIGVWHGAGLNFIIFGLLHASAYALSKFYSFLINMFNLKISENIILRVFYWMITFLFISFTFVFFRSSNFESALNITYQMLNISSLTFPSYFSGNSFFLIVKNMMNISLVESYVFLNNNLIIITLISFLIVIFSPNTKEISEYIEKNLFIKKSKQILNHMIFYSFFIFLAFLIISSIFSLNNQVVFLYYQF